VYVHSVNATINTILHEEVKKKGFFIQVL